MKILELKRIFICLATIVSVSILLTSCEQTDIVEPANLSQYSKIDMAQHEALIANPDLVVLAETSGDNLQSRNHCTQFAGGLACPAHAEEARLRYLCYAEAYRTNPTEVNRINRDTAYCDYLLAFNLCFGTNLKCPSEG